MRHTFFSVIFIALQFMSCTAQDSQSSNMIAEELEWKKEWIDIFFQKYRSYQENEFENCYDSDRSVIFDIERKVMAINHFSFGTTLTELKNFIATNEIICDSLMMNNSHSWYNEEEFNFAPVSFYLYTREGIRKLDAFFDDDQRPAIIEDREDVNEFYENTMSLKNGCGYGFITLTVFNNNLSSWEINRIVINPDE